MAISVYDFTKGIDFTALASAAAGDHNTLVDAAVPYATDKGLVMVSSDAPGNIPDVPNPNAAGIYDKWKNYIWIRRPHSTATSTTPIVYVWNENLAISDPTYYKWQRIPADTTAVEALITALDLRVDDLEAQMATALATANAANATANTASTNASSALSTANAANANATTALSDLNTPTTGVKDRVSALESDVNTAEGNITSLQTRVTDVENSINSSTGPVFIAPVTLYSATGARAFTDGDFNVSANVPAGAKAVILEARQDTATGVIPFTMNVRSSVSSYVLLVGGINADGLSSPAGANQGIFPITTARTFQMEITAATGGTVTMRLVGYIL